MTAPARRLTRDDYARDPVSLAKFLLGQRLVRIFPGGERASGIIVETEAYLGAPDKAAHSYGGRRTRRTEVMYGPPGLAYVYFTYGMHHMFNVICGAPEEPVAVLVRALEPEEGLEGMRARRGAGRDDALCSGPAKLCQALGIDLSLNGLDLATDGRLFLELARGTPLAPEAVGESARIGVDYAGEWAAAPLRWFVRENPHVSRSAPRAKPLPEPAARVPSCKSGVGPRAARRRSQ